MNKCLILFSIVFGLVILHSYASNLPTCKGNYWTNCFGTDTYTNGDKYLGEFKDNKRNGHGTYTYANGDKYVGEYKDNLENGQGTFTFADGDKFFGGYKDGKYDGFGTYIFADGSRDVGQWENGKLNGSAIQYNADGSIYRQGIYKDDEFQYAKKIESKNPISNLPACKGSYNPNTWTNCFGTYIGGNSQGKWAGDKYVGEFVDGSFNGKGTYYFLGDHEFKGDIYIGEFKDNLKHGQGTYTFADGDKYIGEHKDNLKHGQGTYTFSNGAKYVGEFRDGEYNGQGIFIFSNGDKYVGEFNDSLRHGQGTYTYATGKIEEGIWKDDEFLYAKKIEPATQINIPDNAYASGNSWKCNSGYFKYGDACFKIPENAYASGNSWKCKSGFEQSGNTCKKKPESKIEVQPEEVLQAASGTGFIVSEEGHIVTNHHVIEGCAEVKVHKDGKVYKGNVIANDIMNDLALIKSNYKPNVIFPLSDKNPSLLQDIYVAGFPFGNAISSSVKVTKGVVSSETGIGNNYSNIQIDAAIQPGNSGGPILDDYGNVIGVAVAKLAMEKIYEDFGVFPENTNFGIKSSVVENLIQAHNVNNPPPNTEEINKSDLGYNIKQATLYLSCWMTLAQIKKFSTQKVIFRDLVN